MKPRYGVVVQPGTTTDQKKTGWRIFRPRFLQEKCIGDRACELLCPDGAVYRIDKRKFDADMDACKGCGICAEMCPVGDIVMELEELPGAHRTRHVSEAYPSSISGAGEAGGDVPGEGGEGGR